MKFPKIKTGSKKSAPTPRRRLSDDTLSLDSAQKTVFRRNSTITGSRSGNIRSAGEIDSQLKSPRATTHHLRRKQRSLSAMFAGAMVAVTALTILLYQFTAEVSTPIYGQLNTASASRDDAFNYSSSVQDYLARYPIQRLRFTVNPDSLTAYLQSNGHPEILSVESVQAIGFGSTEFRLKVREPVAAWLVDGKTKYVDNTGSIFTVNYFEEPPVKIIDSSRLTSESGPSSMTSSRFLTFVGQAVGALQEYDLAVRQVIIPASGTRTAELLLEDKNMIKMTIDREAGEQAEDAYRALEHLSDKGQSLEYVDVRVGGYAYYR